MALIMTVCFTLTTLEPGLVFCKNIDIRVSVKIIVDLSGNRPAGITDELFNDAAEAANQWQASYYRGYRFRITEIVEIGGPNQDGATGPSKWFGIDPRSPDDLWIEFQEDVTGDHYQKRSDHLNFYVSTGPVQNPGTGGKCPSSTSACYALANSGPWWLVHEPGHFFGLLHTHQGDNRDECIPGDDGIGDTLPDIPALCWTSIDDVANYHYSMNYEALKVPYPLWYKLVGDTYFNVMSYHEAANKDLLENRMTELQLDRVADYASGIQNAFVSGKTWFVKAGKEIPGIGDSVNEFQFISEGVAAANNAGGDILLLRPGVYPENLTISKPLTIRATRVGPVFIGE